jgi:hypothetical protein
MATITEKEIRQIVRKVLRKKLNESSDFTARRIIQQQAMNTSMEFEKEIVSQLGLTPPDTLAPHVQKKYFEIVEEMKAAIIKAVQTAVTRMAYLPRENKEGNK